jgi:hypothetical protein
VYILHLVYIGYTQILNLEIYFKSYLIAKIDCSLNNLTSNQKDILFSKMFLSYFIHLSILRHTIGHVFYLCKMVTGHI